MNEKDFDTIELATAFIESLVADDNAVDMAATTAGKIRVMWIKNKKYVSHDGKTYTDEVWTTADGTMVPIQDLEPEHARNIIRMMLRQEREYQAMLKQVVEEMYDEFIDRVPEGSDMLDDFSDNTPRVLH